MTIEEVMNLIDVYWDIAWQQGFEQLHHDTPDGKAQQTEIAIRTALSALVAQARDEARAEYDVALRDVRNQARDEEAEAIFYDVCRAIPGLMMCDENGSPNIPYDKRAQVLDDIRARIAGRKAQDGGART